MGAAVALTATSAGTVAFPYFTGKLMDGFSESLHSPDTWIELVNTNTTACVAALGFVGLGGFARAYLLETASEKISRRLRLDLFRSLLGKSQSFFDTSRTGDLVSRLGTDVTRVSRSVMDGAFGLRVLLNAAAGTAMVAKTVPLILVPQLLAPVVVMFLGGVAYGRVVRNIARSRSEAESRAMQVAEENLSLGRTVKLFGGEQHSVSKYTAALDNIYALAHANALATGGRVTAFVTIGGGFVLHVVYNCGMLISGGTLTLGQTAALAGYLLVCGNAYQGLVTAYGDIQKALGACERVVDLLDSPAELAATPGGQRSALAATHSVGVELRNVSFRYTDADEFVLKSLSMTVPPGAKQAVVGLSGCGKSSVLMLLSGLYPVTSGEIRFSGSLLDPQIRKEYMAVVPQDTALFNDSIRNNVWFPSQHSDVVAEQQLAAEARLDFVSDWDAPVGERGQNLSGGERQRIAIARALAKRKPLLLLDEATSALDRESDAVILDHLKKSEATVIAVTHRMSAIEWSDRLTVVDDGRVVQEGATNDLLKNPGPVLKRLLSQIHNTQP